MAKCNRLHLNEAQAPYGKRVLINLKINPKESHSEQEHLPFLESVVCVGHRSALVSFYFAEIRFILFSLPCVWALALQLLIQMQTDLRALLSVSPSVTLQSRKDRLNIWGRKSPVEINLPVLAFDPDLIDSLTIRKT